MLAQWLISSHYAKNSDDLSKKRKQEHLHGIGRIAVRETCSQFCFLEIPIFSLVFNPNGISHAAQILVKENFSWYESLINETDYTNVKNVSYHPIYVSIHPIPP